MAKYIMMVRSNPVAGREDEYNDWYSNRHLQDVVGVPGFRSAERFKLQIPMIGDHKYRYLALYDMDRATDAEREAFLDRVGKAFT